MKKNHFYFLLIVLAISIIASSCTKNETTVSSDLPPNDESADQNQNEATWISLNKGTDAYVGFSIKVAVGHTSSECGGECIKFLGQCFHLDCRGFGSTCTLNGKVMMDSATNSYTLTTIDYFMFGETLDFQFPDRSLLITNPQNSTDLWLNIPEQVLIRSNYNNPFTLYNVWFSEEPDLENQ